MRETPFSLQDKTILITGASSGIGKSTAILCASLGATCILAGRNEDRLNSVLVNLNGSGHYVIQADISEQDEIRKLCENCLNLDAIIHSAGIIQLLPYRSISISAFEKMMKINLYAPFFITQTLLKKKKINNGSAITFISSISGPIIGSKGNLIYSASKSGVNGMTKVLALELAEKRIRVNSISSGMVKTEMWVSENMVVSQEQLAKDEDRYPLGYGNPEDIANIAAFLVSDAAKWITGSSIVADGGFSIQ
jgi:NAD(P)-dependent dehydrogenase (short-subunit alcohol dehydrogenase family)